MKLTKRYQVILALVLVILLLSAYFRPRTLGDRLRLTDMDGSGIAYCSFADISSGCNDNWYGPASELVGPGNELLGRLFHAVSLSGPVFYKNGAVNADAVNLYLSLPRAGGVYQRNTIELILSYANNSENYSAFINIDNKGYFVTSGKPDLALFIEQVRDNGFQSASCVEIR